MSDLRTELNGSTQSSIQSTNTSNASFAGRDVSSSSASVATFNAYYQRASEALVTYERETSEANYTLAESQITCIDRHRREALANGALESDLGYQSTLEARLQVVRRETALNNLTPQQMNLLESFNVLYKGTEEILDQAEACQRAGDSSQVEGHCNSAKYIIDMINDQRCFAIGKGVPEFLLGYQSTLEVRLNAVRPARRTAAIQVNIQRSSYTSFSRNQSSDHTRSSGLRFFS